MAGVAEGTRAASNPRVRTARSGVPTRIGQFGAIQNAAPSFGVEVSPLIIHDANDIERGIAAVASKPNGGLIVPATPLAARYRDAITRFATQLRLPAIYSASFYVKGGGLISYGPDISDHFGALPATSTVSLRAKSRPTCRCRRRLNMRLVINMKTAKRARPRCTGLVLTRADEVIE